MRRILTIVSGLVLALSTSAAQADVASFWQGVLDAGYEQGDTIRVVFVSSGTIDGNGDSQSPYDSFGDQLAAGGRVTGALGASEWRPLVSTQQDVNAGNSPVAGWLSDDPQESRAVFNTSGQLVAMSGGDMLRQSPNDNVDMFAGIRYDESGDDKVPGGGTVGVWTGTNADGTPSTDVGSGTPAYLGSESDGDFNYGMIGDGGETTDGTLNDWLEGAVSVRSIEPFLGERSDDFPDTGRIPLERSIYVMSGDITVVPEPSTVLLWLGCSGLAGLFFWRKRRRS